jgi:hypothetical protein
MLFEDTAVGAAPTTDLSCSVGDIWLLGPHVLAVADSLDPNLFPRDADPPVDTVFFDPPYDLEPAWLLRYPEARNLIVCCDTRRIYKAARFLDDCRAHFEIVWEGGGMTMSSVWPSSRHRSFLVGLRSPELWKAWLAKVPREVVRYGLDTPTAGLSSVYRRKQAEKDHPHEKPRALLSALFSGVQARHVFDPFAGSGTSFFAAPPDCSVTAVEQDPGTAQKILSRWVLEGGCIPVRTHHAGAPCAGA